MRVSSCDVKTSKKFDPFASSSCVLYMLEPGLARNIAEFRVELCPKLGPLSIISRINKTVKGLLFSLISLSRASTQMRPKVCQATRLWKARNNVQILNLKIQTVGIDRFIDLFLSSTDFNVNLTQLWRS